MIMCGLVEVVLDDYSSHMTNIYLRGILMIPNAIKRRKILNLNSFILFNFSK